METFNPVSHLVCPQCTEFIVDPIIVCSEGDCVCRECVIKVANACPKDLCRGNLLVVPVPNKLLRAVSQRLPVTCHTCHTDVPLNAIRAHVLECDASNTNPPVIEDDAGTGAGATGSSSNTLAKACYDGAYDGAYAGAYAGACAAAAANTVVPESPVHSPVYSPVHESPDKSPVWGGKRPCRSISPAFGPHYEFSPTSPPYDADQ